MSSIADSTPGAAAALEYVRTLRQRFPLADPMSRIPDVDPARIPRHIAIIMDGNGRWAQQRGFARVFGHRNGAAAVRAVLNECELLGIETLTLYSFSCENWKRPEAEIDALMQMYAMYLDGESEAMMRRNVRLKQIGRREGLPANVLETVDRVQAMTAANTGPTLCLAVNYGSRQEITDAVKEIARKAAKGEIDPASIDEETVERHLYTAGIADPDLLIRTAGEMRISNYLLWQISYSELYVTDVLWPDFGVPELHAAIRDFAGRRRRFGGLDEAGAV